jgi:hypothetical protein
MVRMDIMKIIQTAPITSHHKAIAFGMFGAR